MTVSLNSRWRAALIVVLSFVAAYLSLANGFAEALGNRSPALTAKVAPWNAAAWSQLAEITFATQNGPHGYSQSVREAGAALLRDPTNVAAVRTMGESLRLMGQAQRGAQLAQLSQRLTWRDLQTQLLAARDAMQSGKAELGLRHLSAALLTDDRSWPLITPKLLAASADPSMVKPLAQLLAINSRWREEFDRVWIPDAPNVATMAQLSTELDRIGHPLSRDLRIGVLGRLIGARRWELVRNEYARARPGLRGAAQTLTDGFPASSGFIPLDWQITDVSDAIAAFEGGKSAPPTLSAQYQGPGDVEVARRLMILAPGTYRLSMPVAVDEASSRAFNVGEGAGLQLACAENGSALLGEGFSRGGVAIVAVTVPPGCGAQWLFIRMRTTAPGILVIRARPVSLASTLATLQSGR